MIGTSFIDWAQLSKSLLGDGDTQSMKHCLKHEKNDGQCPTT